MADAPQKPADAPAPTITPEAPAPVAPVAPVEESQEIKDLRAKAATADTLQFNADLAKVAKDYPRATEFEAKIKEKVAKGYSATDAALIVLHENNALTKAEPQTPQRPNSTRGAGGSMDNPPPRDQADPVPGEAGSAEFYAARLQDLERKGEIFIS